MPRSVRPLFVLVPLTALSLVLAGCIAAPPTATTTPSVTAGPNRDAAVTVPQENVTAAVAALPGIINRAMTETGIPGLAVSVVSQGEVMLVDGFGVRNMDTGDPVDKDTVFALASVSKSIGATVVAHAVDEGLVDWDTPVTSHLPELALADPWVTHQVTIADLYAHRSGLYEHAGDDLEDLGYRRSEVLERLRHIPLAPFRSSYAYANFDITAAAESVARAAEEDWAELSERLLYAPLGMEQTSSRFSDLETAEDRAVGHMPHAGAWIVAPEQRNPDEQSPAGGVSSSAQDLATWMTMLLDQGGGLISADALTPALSPQIVSNPPATQADRAGFYGYGFNVGTTSGGLVNINHSGAFLLGAGTTFSLLPDVKLGIAVLTNAQANGVAEAVAAEFLDIAQYGHARQDWLELYGGAFAGMVEPFGRTAGEPFPRQSGPPAALGDYSGVYHNDFYGPATVTVEGGQLQLRLGPEGIWDLQHWEGTRFVFDLDGENAAEGSRSLATFDQNTLNLEFFDQEGMGTFVR